MPITFATGSLVEVRGERWLLTSAVPHGAHTVLTLEGRDRDNARRRLRVIDPFDRSRRINKAQPKRRPRRAVLRAALGAIVDARSASGLWTAADAAIDLLAYQLEPALAAVNGATRLLLADAVGLGKTIQAGLILAELRERGWVDRALIVCPAGLRATWAHELAERFNVHAAVLDQTAIAERVAALPPGANPWAGHSVTIASTDFVKRAEVLAALEHEPFDLLIADEAHHLTPGTDRGAALSRIASRTPWCVLLSATPHSGDAAAFDYLKNIGAHGESITIFRRSRQDVGFSASRRTHLLPVVPSAAEAALFAALDRYTRAIWHEGGRTHPGVRLVAMMMARRAASSALAIGRTLTRRLELLTVGAPDATQALLPWDDEDEGDLADADAMLSLPGLDSASQERSIIEHLIELVRQCTDPAKLRRVRRLVSRLQEPVVIFTEYRDSLEAVVAALPQSTRAASIHGGVPADVRRTVIEAFNNGGLDVLVATDAAGEGLNLHHRCRLVIDLELPWNPLRLEQRIGRVDRLGQRRTVHAIRLFHAHTIEQRVLEHLRLRDRRAQDALREHHVTERSIAEAIFSDESPKAAPAPVIIGTRVANAVSEAEWLERRRRAHRGGAISSDGLVWNARRTGQFNTLLMLTRRSFVNDAGADVHDAVDAHAIVLRGVHRPRVCREVIEHERDRLAAATVTESECIGAPRAMIRRRILALLANTEATMPDQASLFDRRAETALIRNQATVMRRNQALTRVLGAIGLPAPGRTRVEVVAAWPEKRR